MIILGLTGSIGMGKSNAAKVFRYLGVPVHDADAAVHRLMAKGGAAVPAIARRFPTVVVDGAVDRRALGDQVFQDAAALRDLEAILHPLVRHQARRFIAQQARRRTPILVLDIPLLFETGGEGLCDAVIVVSAPARIQEARVLSRPGMTREKFEAIRAKQTSDAEKRRRADFVVYTGAGKARTLRRLAAIVRLMRGQKGCRWPPRPRGFFERHAKAGPRHA